MLCYRRRGHNEGDDPSMTQPAMYDVIDTKRGVRKTYTESLIGRGDISMNEAEDALRDYQRQLERVFNEVRELEKHAAAASESVESHQMILKGCPPRSIRRCWPASGTRIWRTARASTFIRGSNRCSTGAARWPMRARLTGRSASCWHWVHCWSKARRSGSPGRIPGAVRSPSATR